MINKRVNAVNIRYLCTHNNVQYKLYKKGYIQISNLYYRLHFSLSTYYDTLSILFTTPELVFFLIIYINYIDLTIRTKVEFDHPMSL